MLFTFFKLVNILNTALKRMGVNTEPEGNSILNSWISADGGVLFEVFYWF